MKKETNKKNWPTINVQANGKCGWMGGAFSLSFVYSNRGNFLLKGYVKEVEEYLKKEKQSGLKYFVRHNLYPNFDRSRRTILDFYKDDVGIFAPSKTEKKIY